MAKGTSKPTTTQTTTSKPIEQKPLPDPTKYTERSSKESTTTKIQE